MLCAYIIYARFYYKYKIIVKNPSCDWINVNYLLRKLLSRFIRLVDLSIFKDFDDFLVSTTGSSSSTLSAVSPSLNRYDPGVDGDETNQNTPTQSLLVLHYIHHS